MNLFINFGIFVYIISSSSSSSNSSSNNNNDNKMSLITKHWKRKKGTEKEDGKYKDVLHSFGFYFMYRYFGACAGCVLMCCVVCVCFLFCFLMQLIWNYCMFPAFHSRKLYKRSRIGIRAIHSSSSRQTGSQAVKQWSRLAPRQCRELAELIQANEINNNNNKCYN